MSKEIENIGQVASVGELPRILEATESSKAEVEATLVERVKFICTGKKKCFATVCFNNLFICIERSFARDVGGMGAMREEDERCASLDR